MTSSGTGLYFLKKKYDRDRSRDIKLLKKGCFFNNFDFFLYFFVQNLKVKNHEKKYHDTHTKITKIGFCVCLSSGVWVVFLAYIVKKGSKAPAQHFNFPSHK